MISREGALVEGVAELRKFPLCAPMSGASLIVSGTFLAAKPLRFDCIASVMISLLFARNVLKSAQKYKKQKLGKPSGIPLNECVVEE